MGVSCQIDALPVCFCGLSSVFRAALAPQGIAPEGLGEGDGPWL